MLKRFQYLLLRPEVISRGILHNWYIEILHEIKKDMIPINDPDFSTLLPGEFPKFPCFREVDTYFYGCFQKYGKTPKSSILIGVSIINHPFCFFSTYFWKHPYVFQGENIQHTIPHPSPEMMTKKSSRPGRWIARMHQLGRPFPKHVCTSLAGRLVRAVTWGLRFG